MPTWLAIVLGVFVALVIILAIGGIYGRRRQLAATQGRFDANLAQVNRDLSAAHADEDRKSTRLNSSHANISYAVFCLKKKKNKSTPLTFLKKNKKKTNK